MAANSKAIGLLFDVAGGGNINGETGKRINGQLRNLVGAINRSDTLKLKFTIDSNHFKKEIDLIKKQLQSINSTSGGGTNTGGAGGAAKSTEAWKNATTALNNYYRLLTQVQQAMTRTTSITGDENKGFDAPKTSRWKVLTDQFNAAKSALDGVTISEERQAEWDTLLSSKKAKLALDMKTFEATGRQAWSNLTAKVHDYIGRVEESANREEQAKQKLQGLRKMANGTDWRGYDALKDKLGEVQTYINQNSLATETWYQKMLKTFGTRVRSLLAGLILAKVTTVLRDIYKNVVEIDSAMTQLRIVTGASDAQMTKFLTNSTKLAKELGASIKDVLKSVETFSRLGYNLTDATILSEYTTIMSKVAAVSTEEATKGITAIIKGYGFDPTQSEHIADVLINVGQKYAVSASELMEAYAKAGAALNATNTSFEKSAGLIAAANASIQDASVVGTALKTVSARIRKSKADLDDLGETADDLAKSWSVYAEEIEKLTGFNIMVEGSTTQFKDLYDIFDGLAKVWNNLGDEAETTQARVAEILGGTRQYQVISSILSNWGDAAGAYNDAMNSANVSSEAMATYIDSVEGRIGQLKATFEELSQSVLSSSWIKTIANAISGLISLLNSLLSVGDGILLKVGLWIAAIYALYSAWGKATVSLKLVRKEIIHLAASESILAKQNGVTMATTELLTHATLKYMSTGLLGIITFIPRAVAALGLWIAGLFKAKFATDAATGSAYTLKGALDLLNVNPIMLAITGIIAAGAALIKIISAVDKAWKDSYDEAIEAAQKQQELIDAYDSEIDSLESLQEKLEAAHGDRQKLSQIYSELNRKVATSTGLLKGEESAYAAVNAQLQDRITAMKKLREEALKERISQQRSAFASQKGVRYGGIFNWDWVARDASGETMRELMRGDISEWSDTAYASIVLGALNSNNGLDLDDIGAILNYEAFYEKLTKEQQNALIELMGFTRDSWEDYWDGQVAIAKDVFSETISNSSGYFSDTFLDSALERLIRGGYDLDETSKIITDLLDGGDTLNVAIEKYYSALESGDNSAKDLYQDIMRIFDGYIEKYPELTNLLTTVMGSIRGFTSSNGVTVALKSVLNILDEVQGGFDGISKALDSLSEDGYLTADSLASLAKLESDGALGRLKLKDILIQDANGFKIAEDALQKYVDALIEAEMAQYANAEAFATLQDKENVIANLENLRRVLYTLSKTQATSTDATKAQKKALEDQKDALKDELDAYKKLIDLRKELLQQYEDELTYKKELAEKERRVSQLQTQLAVSQLDTSAAGRAKSRQLSKDLKEAQEELDDFTLEHAIDVVTNELDTQYAEHENYINGQIDGIEDKIDDLGSSTSSSISGAANSVATAAASAADKITEAISAIELAPVINVTAGGGGTSGGGSGYFEQAKAYIASHGLMQGDKGRWGQDPAFREILNQLTPEEFAALKGYTQGKAVYDANGRLIRYEKVAPTYHSGGIVGDMTRLKSTELFAKLLKGEFVATPQMMNRFMTSTLPTIASNGGNTEINAPLISIQCDNVTQESLPRLEEIVNEAVKTIKKQFDDGLGRAGYHKTVKKMV